MSKPLSDFTPPAIKNHLLDQMAAAIAADDWEAAETCLGLTEAIKDIGLRAEVLNGMLAMPGHELHQQVAMDIQQLKSPSSVAVIEAVLESGFDYLQYTCSEDEVIAKWFSHALASIGTPDAIALIRKFAASGNAGIASEMQYRLQRLGF